MAGQTNPVFEADGPEDAVEAPVHGVYKQRSDELPTSQDRYKASPVKDDHRQSMPGYEHQQHPLQHQQPQRGSGSHMSTGGHSQAPSIPAKTPLAAVAVDGHPVKAPESMASSMPEKFGSAQPQAFRYDGEKQALEAVVDLASSSGRPDKPYPGMGKEDLLRFSQTPFWNRFRLFCTIMFWLVWAALLGTVIGLTVTFPQCVPPPDQPWDETAVYYHIYVRSFFDSNGDGVGDLEGIREKLPYLSDLQVNAIILSSIYLNQPGPNPDYGYEILNHTVIDPVYGTEEELDRLLAEAQQEWGIRVIMEFIPNYTGTHHAWFNASMADASTGNPYWNYYVWTECDTTTTTYINNWRTVYGEDAWSSGGDRGVGGGAEYCYLNQFLDTQAELNLRSAVVQKELEDIMRFWLERGVDGFQTDKVMYLFEDADFRDEPDNGQCTGTPPIDDYNCYDHIYTTSQNEIYPLVAKWRDVVDEFSQKVVGPDGETRKRVLITDANTDVNTTLLYYGKYGPDGAHFPLNYVLTRTNTSCTGKCVQRLTDDFLYGVPMYAAANWMTGTQDSSRFADIMMNPSMTDWGWQNAYTLLKLTMPGAAILYYGEEIGMMNVNTTGGSRTDPAGIINAMYSRDPYRTPMQWTMDEDAGFISDNATGTADPWLPVGDNLYNISVEAQNATDPHAPYEFHRALIDLRNASRTFNVGAFQYTLLTDNVVSYYRSYEGLNRYLVAINFGPLEEEVNVANSFYAIPGSADVALTTRGGQDQEAGGSTNLKSLNLRPGDGVVVTWEYVRPDGK